MPLSSQVATQISWSPLSGLKGPQRPAGSTHSSTRGLRPPEPPRYAHGDLTSLAPHERLPEILVVPREKTPTGAAARGNPYDATIIAR